MNIEDIIWLERFEDKIICKDLRSVLIITARDMTRKEIRKYGRK